MWWLGTYIPRVSHSSLSRTVNRLPDRATGHTSNYVARHSWGNSENSRGQGLCFRRTWWKLYTGGSLLAGSSRGSHNCHFSTVHNEFYNTSTAYSLSHKGASGPCPQALQEWSGTTGEFYFQVEGRFCGLPTFELFTIISPTSHI